MVKIVVDSSAIIAIVTDEAEASAFADVLVTATARQISAVNVLEARIVLTLSKRMPADTVDDFLFRERIAIVPFDETLSDLAFEAYRRFGKGRHPAKLNMGDCAAYALAKSRGWPLLYKGEDFAQTDIERA